MLNFKKKGKYYKEAPGFRISAAKVNDRWKFVLWDMKTKPPKSLGVFENGADAEALANFRMGNNAGNAVSALGKASVEQRAVLESAE